MADYLKYKADEFVDKEIIKLLKRNKALEVEYDDVVNGENSNCPHCNKEIKYYTMETDTYTWFCPNCGQKLKWVEAKND